MADDASMGLTDTEAGMAGDGGREDETGQEARSSRSPLVNRVHQRLLAWIEAGEFQTDQRLPGEMDLAAQFLVSRPVVREALRLLREQGLIYSRRGSGSFVRAASPSESSTRALGFAPVETIADIQRCYEFRLTIEPDHAYWAALRWNETMLAAIATALDLLRDATRAHQHREDADFAFHCAIAEASNNHYFVSSMTALKDHIGVGMKFHGVSLMGPTSALQGVFDEHAAIFDAIRNRDASRARNLMRSHLKGSRDRVFGGKILDLSF